MRINWFGPLLVGISLILAASAIAQEQKPFGKPIRIGILNDRSGPYADITGEGSAVAARMAAEEFDNKIDGVPIEILVGDHMNKPDIGQAIVRRWFDNEQVDVVADITNSGVGFAVTALAKERNKIVLNNSGSSDFTGNGCISTQAQWAFNSYAVSKALASALLKEKLDSVFIIGADYAFSRSVALNLKNFMEAGGGKIVGEVFHPLNTADFSSFLLQAQASGAKAIVTANGGNDLTGTVKQAAEFNISAKQVFVLGTPINQSEIAGLGLEASQGLLASSIFEWTRTARSRQWTKHFVERTGSFPTGDQAATYSAVRHYLKAVAAAHTINPPEVMAKMRELPVNDAFAENAHLREDGQMVHDLFLVRVKKPSESTEKGDYTSVVETLKGEDVYQPLSESDCPLVKKK
jgi:branched-chain amino acid transport system substrate-binding protein